MSDTSNDGSTVADNGSANTTDDGSTDNQNSNSVSLEEHEHVKRDMFRYKDKYKSLENELESFKSRFSELEKKGLAEANDYKTLYERAVEENNTLKSDRDNLKQSVLNSERYRAVTPKLREMGLREDAENLLDLQDLSGVEIEATSSGRFICHGVEAFAETFKKNHPYAFKQKSLNGVNGSGGSNAISDSGPVTASDVITAEKEFKAGKISKQQYEATYRKYAENRQRA